jgi:hypothetical protein
MRAFKKNNGRISMDDVNASTVLSKL